MSEIKTYPVSKEEAAKAAPLLSEEAAEALEKGLPLTAFVAVKENEAIGAVTGAIDGQIFEIWSLYVDPEHRRQGAGRALIAALEELLVRATGSTARVAGMPIRVRYTSVTEDNMALRPFLLKLGFIEDPIPHPTYYIGYLQDLKSKERLSSRSIKTTDEIMSFAEAGEKVLNAASAVSDRHGYPMPEGGLTAESVDQELSLCAVRDGKVMAYVTVEEVDEDLIEISSLWSGLDNPVELLAILIRLIDALRERYTPETRVAMLSTTERVDKLIDYLFRYVEQRSYRMVKVTNW